MFSFEGIVGLTVDVQEMDARRTTAFGLWFGVVGVFAPYQSTYESPSGSASFAPTAGATLGGLGGEGAVAFRFARLSPATWVVSGGLRVTRLWYTAPPDIALQPLSPTLFASIRALYGSSSVARGFLELRPSCEWSPSTRYQFTGDLGTVVSTGPSVGFVMGVGAGVEFL